MNVTFLSINTLSTIPVLRYILRDLARHYLVKVVHCKIENQPLNVGQGVVERAIGTFWTSQTFNQQSFFFKIKKYTTIYLAGIAICLKRNQIIISQDFQVVSFFLSNSYLLSVHKTKLIYFQFELVDYDKMSLRDRSKLETIRKKSKHLDLAIFPEINRLEYFCQLINFERSKTMLFPNTCNTAKNSLSGSPEFRGRIPHGAAVIGHVGNIGPDHFLNEFLAAVESFARDPRIFFVMVGRQSEQINSVIKNIKNPNFISVGEVPHDRLSEIYPIIHYGLILYKGVDKNFEFCAPNKLYEYWSYGIPVLAHRLSGLLAVINEPRLGKTLDLENDELIPYITLLLQSPLPNRSELKSYFDNNLAINTYLAALHARFQSL